jgi:hypothetical protein
MKADVAFFQARQKLEEARRDVTEALTQLKLAAESRNRNTQRANQLLTAVGPAAQALEKALRAVDASLGEPGATPEPSGAPLPPPASEGQQPAAPQQGPGATTPPAAPQQGVRTSDTETQQRPGESGAGPAR